jgi:formylglycine-generating enzyme required for sulfatase activity
MAFRALLFLLSGLLAGPAQAQEKKDTVAIPDSTVKFELVLLAGGKAKIGSADGAKAEPARDVDLRPFWIGSREVTWEEYSLYYEARKKARLDGVTRPSQPDVIDPKEPFPNGEAQGATHPAISIGWYGAVGYCEWLTRKTGEKYRLPTEAEWEYAARGGSAEVPLQPLDDFAWYEANSGKNSHEVGQKKPGPFGLYDMLGNAWENCLEPFAPPAHLPVVRGGGWNSPARDLRPSKRQAYTDDWAERDPKRPLRLWWLTDGNFVGFRLVRVPGSSLKESDALAAKVQIRNLKIARAGKRPDYLDRISGEIVYGGDSPLDEVEVTVFFLDEEGKPMMKDPKDKPCFGLVYPVLANSYHEGQVREPLAKGATRTFELDVPHPFLETGPLDADKVGAKVSYVHAAK